MTWLLVCLALTDATFCGYRDAAGRNPLLDKRRWYLTAALRGALGGLLVVGVFLFAANRFGTRDGLEAAAARMVTVYGVYASFVFAALAVWLFGRGDLRTLGSVAVLGPFTLVRPWVIAGGALWALTAANGNDVLLICAAAATMIVFEKTLAVVSRRAAALDSAPRSIRS